MERSLRLKPKRGNLVSPGVGEGRQVFPVYMLGGAQLTVTIRSGALYTTQFSTETRL